MYAEILEFREHNRKHTVREDFLNKALTVARQLNRQEMTDTECAEAFKDIPSFTMEESHDK